MSTKPETVFTLSVHKHLPPSVYHLKMHNQYVGGPADVWYSGVANDLWIEYKFIEVPKRVTTLIDIESEFSPLQLDWLESRHKEGRNIRAIIGSKLGGVMLNSHTWRQPIFPKDFYRLLQTRETLAAYITYFTSIGGNNVRQIKRSTAPSHPRQT